MPPRTVHVKAKVCLAGQRAVGKTSLLRRFDLDVFEEGYTATLGARISKKGLNLEFPEEDLRVRMDMTIWDIVGDRDVVQLLGEAYYHGAQGILAVCDVTRQETLEEIPGWRDLIVRRTGRIPWVLAANKVDLAEEAVVQEAEVQTVAEALPAPLLPTSAKTGQRVQEAFELLGRRIAASGSVGGRRMSQQSF